MSAITTIEWTDRSWNVIRGCSVISPGCVNCYAMKQAHRFAGAGKPFEGLTKQTKAGPQWTGKVITVEDALLEPLSWRKPQRVFVNSMSDLFHEDVPFEFIDQVFAVMALAPRHTFQILTKRATRMYQYMSNRALSAEYWKRACPAGYALQWEGLSLVSFPLSNVWLGVSVEDQQHLERVDTLKDVPAAVRFVSVEPLLEDLGALILDGIDWVIVGGESGPRARPCAIEWIESVVDQCVDAAVPVFVKQLGAYIVSEERTAPRDFLLHPERLTPVDIAPNGEAWAWRMGTADRKGGDPSEWPADLNVREFPEVRQ